MATCMKKLFDAVRYGLMTGSQLVTHVRPFVDGVVSRDLYVQAVEQVAAPEVECVDQGPSKRSCLRLPPLDVIRVSDTTLLEAQTTSPQKATLRKTSSTGWDCTAVVKPRTTRTRFVAGRPAGMASAS